MLTQADAELGYPQYWNQEMGKEVPSQDFFYQVSGTEATLNGMPTEEEVGQSLFLMTINDSNYNQYSKQQIKKAINTLKRYKANSVSFLLRKHDDEYTMASQSWNACKDSDCKPKHLKSRCDRCRAPHQAKMDSARAGRDAVIKLAEQIPSLIAKGESYVNRAPENTSSSQSATTTDGSTGRQVKSKLPLYIGIGAVVIVGGYFFYRRLTR